jgi:hypothetical protein
MAASLTQRIEQARRIRDALFDRMEGRAAENHNSYSIGDRSISKMTMDEVHDAYQKMDREVQRLERQFRRKTGGSGNIRVKF